MGRKPLPLDEKTVVGSLRLTAAQWENSNHSVMLYGCAPHSKQRRQNDQARHPENCRRRWGTGKPLSLSRPAFRLGAHRNAILDAHSAYTNPRFLVQIGRDVDACIEGGKLALIAAYGLDTVKH